MKNPNNVDAFIAQNESILKKCFECFVQYGLERITIRNLCESTNSTASSLYYRFGNKDRIILFATYYGLDTITKNIFKVATSKVNDFEGLYKAVFEAIEKNKKQIKLIYQVVASPKYGKLFSTYSKLLHPFYDKANDMIAKCFGVQSDILRPYVDLSMSTIREYIIWNDREHAKKQLYFIYDKIVQVCLIGKSENNDTV